MSAYESLAACYDELTYDIRYEKDTDLFLSGCARGSMYSRIWFWIWPADGFFVHAAGRSTDTG